MYCACKLDYCCWKHRPTYLYFKIWVFKGGLLLARSNRRSIGMVIRMTSLIGFSVGLLNPAIHGIRVAFVIAFSVCLYVLCIYVTFFLILLQHNIRPLSPNCNMCATEFVAGVNLKRHDTLRWAVMNVMTIILWEWS